MKLTLSRLYDSYITLQRMSQNKLPIKVSYTIYKNLSTMKTEVKFFENERFKIGEEYVQRDKENNPIPIENSNNSSYKIIQGKEKEYIEKINKLCNTEIEVELYQINLDDLLDSGVSIEPVVFEVLDYIIE